LLNHVAAGLRACATFFSAVGHDFVTRKFLARGCTIVAALRAAGTGMANERALARRQRRAQLTAGGTVDAQLSCALVLFLATRHEAEAMPITRIAAQLAVRACAGARHECFLRLSIGGPAQKRQHCRYQQ
jgi:hypothetical protein